MGGFSSDTALFLMMDFPVTMRAAPTMVHNQETSSYRIYHSSTYYSFNGWLLDHAQPNRIYLYNASIADANWIGKTGPINYHVTSPVSYLSATAEL